jgi:hypothetical protein
MPFVSIMVLNSFAMPCADGASRRKCNSTTLNRDAHAERHVESFNGKLRDECLNAHWFTSLRQARNILESWKTDYNEVRPHSALGYATPNELASRNSAPFAVEILSNTTANPRLGNPGGLASLGLDPAPPSCEGRLT